MKKLIFGSVLICFSLVSSLYLEKNIINCFCLMVGAFLFITGALNILSKLTKNE